VSSPSTRTALISTSDKTGLADFAAKLSQLGFRLLATGGSANSLREQGIPVTEISDYTGFPEIMDGRVKTLHPRIHAGLLARQALDSDVLQQHDIDCIDLLVVNLYPFVKTIGEPDCSFEHAVENIDIGGPCMLRAAAKNHQRVTAVVDPADYNRVLSELTAEGETQLSTRQQLALKVFQHTALYEAAIANYLQQQFTAETTLASIMPMALQQQQPLRYGENPQQAAGFYVASNSQTQGFAKAKLLQGKALSYNNLMDADAAWQCVNALSPQIACVIVKHATPCGVACAPSTVEAYQKALSADSQSAFGGIIAFNHSIDVTTATEMTAQFAEVIVAPAIDDDARKVLAQKANCRVLVMPSAQHESTLQLRSILGGVLVQQQDYSDIDFKQLKMVTQKSPDDHIMQDLLFAWQVVRFCKSNAIVYARDRMTLGIGSGQTSRVFSTEIAALKAKQAGLSLQHAVLASDAFFPFADSIAMAARFGVRAIIQPGGSKRDDEVIEAANQAGICMVMTGVRHFRH